MKNRSTRNRLISLIHAQKTLAQLTEDEYRLIVSGATDHTSCSECTIKELFSIFRDLNIILSKQGKQKFVFSKQKIFPNLKNAILARAKRLLGSEYEIRLNGYLARLKRTSLDDCNNNELRQIMGFLSTLERKNNTKTENTRG